MLFGKQQCGALKREAVPQEAVSSSAVGNVVVAAIRLSVALQKVDMLVDSGLSISLMQESVATAYSRQIERAPNGLELTLAEEKKYLLYDASYTMYQPSCLIGYCYWMHRISFVSGKAANQPQLCSGTLLHFSSDPGH